MKSATSKVVTTLDVSVIVMAIIAGVLCGIVGINSTKELNARLHKVDSSTRGFINLKRSRLQSILILSVPMLGLSALALVDVWTWLHVSKKIKNRDENKDINFYWYIPFYGLYFTLITLHITFANTALSLAKRFKRLNYVLRTSFLPDESYPYKELIKPVKPKVATVLPATTESSLVTSLNKSVTQTYLKSGKNKTLQLKLLAESHESLGKCIAIVSSAYGMAVLFILLSCFLHLVATSYFLFDELLSKRDSSDFIWLQLLWIIFHVLRLLLVVEPCHRITAESSKTIHILCEIERIVSDSILAEEIKKFWQQLLIFDAQFSACGLCLVNRSLLTSLFSAIATYLVILIQFQGNSNN